MSYQMSEDEHKLRLRRATEPLLEDVRLRDGLEDEQAKQLIDWGVAQVKLACMATDKMEDEEALPILEIKVDQIADVLHTIKKILLSDKKRAERLQDLQANLLELDLSWGEVAGWDQLGKLIEERPFELEVFLTTVMKMLQQEGRQNG